MIIKEANRSAIDILNKTYCRTKIQEIQKDETDNKLIDTSNDDNIVLKMTNAQWNIKY